MPASECKDGFRPNLRYHYRVQAALYVELRTQAGETVHCQSANLSRSGLMVSCNPETLRRLLPNTTAVAPRQPVRLEARFDLPAGLHEEMVSIHAGCDVIYVRRNSRDSFHLGMAFADFEGEGREHLNRYVDRCLAENSD